MYGLTSKQIKTKAVIALVIGIAMAVYAIIFQESDVSGTAQIALYFLSPIVLAWGVLGFLINWRKIFKGLIAPIPLVSYLIESLKSFYMAVAALIWAFTHPEA